MSTIDDGGPAFAVPRPHTDAGTGISKRDLFALGAMVGEIARTAGLQDAAIVARRAYAIADAMLEARK